MIAHVLGALHYGTSEYIFRIQCWISMSFENTAHKTKKLKVEENMLAFLEECKKVSYYYTMYIIIDSNMTSC